MSQLLQPTTFEFFATYFLAGFIMMSVRSWFVAGERPKINETLVESLILSLINQLIARGTVDLLPVTLVTPDSNVRLFTEVIGQPTLLGLLIGWLATRNWIPAGLRRLAMPAVRPISPAFEFAFDKLSGPSFVILRFADGGEVYGFFGKDSMVGTNLDDGGIFLEDIYVLSDDESWQQASPPRSAWIDMKDVRSIEFLDG